MRAWPKRNVMAGNIGFREIMANLRRLQPALGFKEDMQMYMWQYNGLAVNKYNPVKVWNNLFMKVMFAIAKAYPGINLKTITKEEIYTLDLPCIYVYRLVEAGLLPPVKGYQTLVRKI